MLWLAIVVITVVGAIVFAISRYAKPLSPADQPKPPPDRAALKKNLRWPFAGLVGLAAYTAIWGDSGAPAREWLADATAPVLVVPLLVVGVILLFRLGWRQLSDTGSQSATKKVSAFAEPDPWFGRALFLVSLAILVGIVMVLDSCTGWSGKIHELATTPPEVVAEQRRARDVPCPSFRDWHERGGTWIGDTIWQGLKRGANEDPLPKNPMLERDAYSCFTVHKDDPPLWANLASGDVVSCRLASADRQRWPKIVADLKKMGWGHVDNYVLVSDQRTPTLVKLVANVGQSPNLKSAFRGAGMFTDKDKGSKIGVVVECRSARP